MATQAEVFVPELDCGVRVRGFPVAELGALEHTPATMPAGVDHRHPAILELVAEGAVSPSLSAEAVAALSDESIELLATAILEAHPETRRLAAAAAEEYQ